MAGLLLLGRVARTLGR